MGFVGLSNDVALSVSDVLLVGLSDDAGDREHSLSILMIGGVAKSRWGESPGGDVVGERGREY